MAQRLQPAGCSCGGDTVRGSFFLPSHDKGAESALTLMKYGGLPELLHKRGYARGKPSSSVSGRAARSRPCTRSGQKGGTHKTAAT